MNLEKIKQINKLIVKLDNEWDYKSKPWQICLHSFQYKLEGKTYQIEKPFWADPNFTF